MRAFFSNPIVFLFCLLSSAVFAESASTTTTPPKTFHHQYGSFYTKRQVSVPPEHAIPFDEQTVLPACGIHHTPGTADFFLTEPGIYRVIYSVSLKSAGGMVALQLNDSVIPGSEMCVGANTQLSTLGMLIKVCSKSCCDYKLRVINNYPNSAAGWYSNDICLGSCCAGDCNVTASLEIERISDCCDDCCSNCCKK
jgi:hypothetical protein